MFFSASSAGSDLSVTLRCLFSKLLILTKGLFVLIVCSDSIYFVAFLEAPGLVILHLNLDIIYSREG